MEMNDNLNTLKQAIIEREVIGNILVKTSGNYHVVAGSVIDFYDDEYTFYFDGYSFNLDLDEIESFCILP